MGRVEEILEFWFGDAASADRRRNWFNAGPGFDQACRDAFEADYERAARGELDSWRERSDGALALILLLDQFPRNMFRATARAFATDARARAVARSAVAAKLDLELPALRRAFVYMPFQHSEDLADQHESVRLFRQLAGEHPEAAGFLQFAGRHLEVIARFGRFPHRNSALRRQSTPEEMEFLASGDSPF